MHRRRVPPSNPRQRGFTLIDVVILLVLLGLVSGMLTVLFTRLSAQSANTLRNRQMLGVAQALLNEVRLMPFTYCDPQDARATTATLAAINASGCQSLVDGPGPEFNEVRNSSVAATRFDGVSDYSQFAEPGPSCPGGICDIQGNLLTGPGSPLQGCSTAVSTTLQPMPSVAATDAHGQAQSLLIRVRVSCPGSTDLVVDSIRMRYAPKQV